MNGYIKAEEIAVSWDISVRQVQILCKSGKVDGAIKFGNAWAIPAYSKKPTRTGNLKPGRKPNKNKNSEAL
ncbi:hypothetical protein FACS189460_4260 [Deltaproteobacteria bacterium]|nr:hypothetical protein FACS189460_4260 [Deltaproteobacteria bacterium]